MFIRLPRDVKYMLKTLNKAGFSAYIVGGSVRDIISKKKPHDYDITTDATPDIISEVFHKDKVIPTGIAHGTMTVIRGDTACEITTFRVDGEYTDSRHPDSITFSKDIKADLSRRDFTVNAMAYCTSSGIIDFFGGREDIKNKIIRTVGDPDKRFFEDALRILRAFRFCSTLGYAIEDRTYAACIDGRGKLDRVSRERVYSEITKLLLGENAGQAVKLLYDSDIIFDVFEKIMGDELNEDAPKCIDLVEKNLSARMALMLKNTTNAAEILSALRAPSALIKSVTNILSVPVKQKYEAYDLLKAVSLIGKEDAAAWAEMHDAELSVKHGGDAVPASGCKLMLEELFKKKNCFNAKDLCVGGDELKNEFGIAGEKIGEVLSAALDAYFLGKIDNRQKDIMKFARDYLSKQS